MNSKKGTILEIRNTNRKRKNETIKTFNKQNYKNGYFPIQLPNGIDNAFICNKCKYIYSGKGTFNIKEKTLECNMCKTSEFQKWFIEAEAEVNNNRI